MIASAAIAPPVSIANRAREPLSEQAFSRAAGAPLVAGNRVLLLRDATANYPAWLSAIRAARRTVFLESYIFDDDVVGLEFAAALAERAKAGVRVRVIRDWVGTFASARRGLFRRLRGSGVDVRCFNPPGWDSPLDWLRRDHRKMIAVDGEVAFVSGLCVGRRWLGDPRRGVDPWRDTGIEVRGPAVAQVERAFAHIWAAMGPPLPDGELSDPSSIPPAGDVSLRVVADAPTTTRLLRLEQLIAVAAQRRLWLADAYFVGIAPYLEALRAAARDGVDVRLLLPNATDLPLVRPLSRAGYRTLLEAGVRVFEWNGSMMHAKTAIADGRWARVGSSNLNWASLVSNYELDVQIDDKPFGRAMEQMYEEDLANATEIVLTTGRKVRPSEGSPPARSRPASVAVAAGAMRMVNAVGAVVANRRALGHGEDTIALAVSLLLLAVAAVGFLAPRAVALPLAMLAAWFALALASRAIRGRLTRGRTRPAAGAGQTTPPRPST